jgi:hypothetical protein
MLDRRAIYKHLPGTSTHYSQVGRTFHSFAVVTNSQGFRGPELRRDPGGKRLVVYGDSNVESDFVADADTFVVQLGKSLGDGVEAVNAGVAGYGPDQVSMRLDDELPALAPHLLVVVVYAGNDYGDIVRDKLFRLDEAGELVPSPYVLSPRLLRRFERTQRGLLLTRVAAEVADDLPRSPTGSKKANGRTADDEMARLSAEEVEHYAHSNVVNNLFYDHYDADVAFDPASASARTKVRLMEKVLVRIARTAARAGTPLVFVLAPSPIDACPGYSLGWTIDPARHPGYKPTNLTDALEDIARRNGFRYVNLWDAVQKSHPCELYFPHHDHWNERGQALASEVVAKYIRANGLF